MKPLFSPIVARIVKAMSRAQAQHSTAQHSVPSGNVTAACVVIRNYPRLCIFVLFGQKNLTGTSAVLSKSCIVPLFLLLNAGWQGPRSCITATFWFYIINKRPVKTRQQSVF